MQNMHYKDVKHAEYLIDVIVDSKSRRGEGFWLLTGAYVSFDWSKKIVIIPCDFF